MVEEDCTITGDQGAGGDAGERATARALCSSSLAQPTMTCAAPCQEVATGAG